MQVILPMHSQAILLCQAKNGSEGEGSLQNLVHCMLSSYATDRQLICTFSAMIPFPGLIPQYGLRTAVVAFGTVSYRYGKQKALNTKQQQLHRFVKELHRFVISSNGPAFKGLPTRTEQDKYLHILLAKFSSIYS